MVASLVQHRRTFINISGNATLPASVTGGNLVVCCQWGRSILPDTPAGFTSDVSLTLPTTAAGFRISHRRALTADGASYAVAVGGSTSCDYALSEWLGAGTPNAVDSAQLAAGAYGAAQSIAPTAPGPVLSGKDVILALFGIHTDIAGRECHVNGSTVLIDEDWVDGSGFGPYGSTGYITQPGPATANYLNTVFHNGGKLAVSIPELAGGFGFDGGLGGVW